MRIRQTILKAGVVVTACCILISGCAQQVSVEGRYLLYESGLATQESVKGWIMEGPGEVSFEKGWMRMFSPDMGMHHVFWCPYIFPDSFVAEWEVQNLNPQSGLLIVFFAASGLYNQDIFHPSLRSRDGTFTQYTKGDTQSYHISYYANSLARPDRGTMNLRKNPGFRLLTQTESPLKSNSVAIHRIRLEKKAAQIRFYVDDRKALDWVDSGGSSGPALPGGRIGFRQMRSTEFQYRNFRVYAVRNKDSRS